MRPYKDSLSVGNGWSNWTVNKEYDYEKGDIKTPCGIVSAYMQGGEDASPHTRLDFVTDGRLHMWSWKKRYSRKYAVTLAKRMAEALASTEESER